MYQPRKQFEAFHYRSKRWACIVAHRRAGKTVACINELIARAIQTPKADARYAYVAPYYRQAKDVAWAYLKRYSEEIRIGEPSESELTVTLRNGSRIRLYGADNADSLRGIYLDGVILDEYADMRPSVWGEIIRPLLADRRGWAVFIGTPKGKNSFWDIYERSSSHSDWFSLSLKASNSGLIAADELADARKGMTEDQYLQEFECSFTAAILGAYYGKEMNEAEPRITTVEYDPIVPVHTAWDLGYSDDTAIWWYQVIAGEIRILECHSSNGHDVAFYSSLVKSKPYKYGLHWLPHDARAKTLASGGKSIEEMLRASLGNGIRIVPSLSLQDGIQAVRAALPRCWFDTGCNDGIEALKQYQREYDEDRKCFRDKPLHDWTSHLSDAFRMLAIAWRHEHKPMKPEPPKFFGAGMGVTVDEFISLASHSSAPDRRI